MEGEYTSIYARTTFPKAKIAEITSMQGSPVLFTNVADGKADVIFQDPATFSVYDEKNPGKLRAIPGGFAASIPGGFLLKYGEDELKRILDYAIDDVISRNVAQRLFAQYGFDKSFDILPPAADFDGSALQK